MKSWTNWKINSFLGSIREVRLQCKLLPPNWRHRPIWRITIYRSRNPQAETTSRDQCNGWKTKTATDELLEAQCGQVWESKTPRRPSHMWVYIFVGFTSRALTRFSWWIFEKNPSCFCQGKGESSHFEYTRAPVLNKAYPQEILFNQSLICWVFIRAWLTYGKGNTQPKPTLAILSLLRVGQKTECICEVHNPEAQAP